MIDPYSATDPGLFLMLGHAWAYLQTSPWTAPYLLGVVTGWTLARKTTRYMLGGRS